MVKLLELFAELKLSALYQNKNKISTYSSTGECLCDIQSIRQCLQEMISPETFDVKDRNILNLVNAIDRDIDIDSKKEIKEECNSCGNNTTNSIYNCNLIQNDQLLLDEIPAELQCLDYGIYPNNQAIYNDLRFVYNKLLNYFPHAIFYPRCEKEISYLIQNFVINKAEFAIRCGGHAYEAASLSSGYILDVKNMPGYIKISKDRKTAKISSGLRLGYVIEKLAEYSLITPTGENSCVGISGLSLAGGKGNLTRLYGLTCDNIVSLKMINYKGELIKVRSKEYRDLLWACKGAGSGNFGVITEFELKVYEDVYCQFETLTWEWNAEQAIEIFILYQDTILTLPNTVSAEFNMTYNNGTASFKIKFIKLDQSHLVESKIFEKLYNPTITTCSGYYSKITDCWIDYEKGKNPPFSKIKSSMIFKPLQKKGIELLVHSIDIYLKKGFQLNYQLNFTQLGGEVVNGHSSYFPKNAIMVLSYFMQWTFPEYTDDSKLFLKKLYQKVLPYTSIYCFPNLIDYDIVDYMEKYYGENKKKLVKIKKKYDPLNIFNYRQSIR